MVFTRLQTISFASHAVHEKKIRTKQCLQKFFSLRLDEKSQSTVVTLFTFNLHYLLTETFLGMKIHFEDFSFKTKKIMVGWL